MLRILKKILKKEAQKIDIRNFRTLDKERIRKLKLKKVKLRLSRICLMIGLTLVVGISTTVIAINKVKQNKNEDFLAEKNKEYNNTEVDNITTEENKSLKNKDISDEEIKEEQLNNGSNKEEEVDENSKNKIIDNNGEDIKDKDENKDKDKDKDKDENKDKDYVSIMEKDEFKTTSAFIGDSITEGLSYYQYMSKNRVLAEMGFTLRKAKGRESEILVTKPKRVFMLFGANDLLMGGTTERFIEDYRSIIKTMKSLSPNLEVYVQSALYVKENVAKDKPTLSKTNIMDVNKKLKVMASEQGAKYIDLNPIIQESKEDLYAYDGIHVQPQFYIQWLEKLRGIVK